MSLAITRCISAAGEETRIGAASSISLYSPSRRPAMLSGCGERFSNGSTSQDGSRCKRLRNGGRPRSSPRKKPKSSKRFSAWRAPAVMTSSGRWSRSAARAMMNARARNEAMKRMDRGDYDGAAQVLGASLSATRAACADFAAMPSVMQELDSLEQETAALNDRLLDKMSRKKLAYAAYSRRTGK